MIKLCKGCDHPVHRKPCPVGDHADIFRAREECGCEAGVPKKRQRPKLMQTMVPISSPYGSRDPKWRKGPQEDIERLWPEHAKKSVTKTTSKKETGKVVLGAFRLACVFEDSCASEPDRYEALEKFEQICKEYRHYIDKVAR